MKAIYFTLALACLFSTLADPAKADVLLFDGIAKEPNNSASGVPRPTRGMHMSAVEKRFGAPQERLTPVGTPGSAQQPPITRWVYPKFTVYFENHQVVTSVVKR